MRPVGVFGGTFDPVHYGHLRTAFELLRAVDLGEVRFIPTGLPPHREAPVASAANRLDMVTRAIDDQPGFVVDDREIGRQTTCYTADTLDELRAESPARPLCLILGMDAFLGLPSWHRWEQIPELAHIVVAHRPGWTVPTEGLVGELTARRGTDSASDLHDSPAGRVYVHAVTQLEISSSGVREIVASGSDPLYLVPEVVRSIIARTGCYRGQGYTDGAVRHCD
ncbi:MAG: nicotinate-nucleotide adenylyltransferase [Gammaproteobacteria bacterium]|nr:nicotinate-nucleotide adenylyltransferase [Gammaproteobacteria bacterium]